MAKKPRLEHVKFVPAKGKTYAYFNTGQKKANGQAIMVPLPPFGTSAFYDKYAAMLAARTKRATVDYTVADMARDYESSVTFRETLSENTQIVYSKTLRRVSDLLGKFPVNALDRSHVVTVIDAEISGPGAYNIFLSVLSAAYKWGRDNGKTEAEPAKGIARREIGTHEPWPEAVLNAGLESKQDDVRLLVKLLYFTGQRVGDVVAMRWTDISNGVLNIIQEKTNKEVWIPLISELTAELAATPKRGIFIVTDADGLPVTVRNVREVLQAFTKQQGQKTVPHGLRKNAVNALLEAECSVAEVASITGQTYAMVEHYAKRINQRRMAESAVLKFENKRGTGKPKSKPAS